MKQANKTYADTFWIAFAFWLPVIVAIAWLVYRVSTSEEYNW